MLKRVILISEMWINKLLLLLHVEGVYLNNQCNKKYVLLSPWISRRQYPNSNKFDCNFQGGPKRLSDSLGLVKR